MDELDQLQRELQQQRRTLEDLLQLARREIDDRPPDSPASARKNVLALLSHSLDRIRQYRTAWLRLDPAQKQAHPEITEVLRENQNTIMKILVLERERESATAREASLRRPSASGPGPSTAEQPAANFLARAYRRNSSG